MVIFDSHILVKSKIKLQSSANKNTTATFLDKLGSLVKPLNSETIFNSTRTPLQTHRCKKRISILRTVTELGNKTIPKTRLPASLSINKNTFIVFSPPKKLSQRNFVPPNFTFYNYPTKMKTFVRS